MKTWIKITSSFLIISNTCFADCQKPVTFIQKGSVTECDGYLHTESNESEVLTRLKLSSIQEELIAKQKSLIGIQDERLILKDQRIDVLDERLKNHQDDVLLKAILSFAVGAALSAYIAVNVR